MRVIFMGTPTFAVPSLRALARAYDVALVLTRPDAVRSRGKKLEPSPVKVVAQELGLPVLETSRITPEILQTLADIKADIYCVAAYGCILPDAVLAQAPLGCVNVHASLLPRWRGAAPIQRSILAGDAMTGVSIMRIGHGVDTGDYCAQASCAVPGKTTDELTQELAELGAKLLVDVLPTIADGSVVWTQQDESLVTHAAKINKAELRLDPAISAQENERRVLASNDAAPARVMLAGKGARVMRALAVNGLTEDTSSEVSSSILSAGELAVVNHRVLIGCIEGTLELLEIKPDGKRAMEASSWAAGIHAERATWSKLS